MTKYSKMMDRARFYNATAKRKSKSQKSKKTVKAQQLEAKIQQLNREKRAIEHKALRIDGLREFLEQGKMRVRRIDSLWWTLKGDLNSLTRTAYGHKNISKKRILEDEQFEQQQEKLISNFLELVEFRMELSRTTTEARTLSGEEIAKIKGLEDQLVVLRKALAREKALTGRIAKKKVGKKKKKKTKGRRGSSVWTVSGGGVNPR